MRSILLFKKLLGLVEMTSGLVNVSFSLPKWQAVKLIFFAPCFLEIFIITGLKSNAILSVVDRNVAIFTTLQGNNTL